jgi:hypothetical protein
LVVGHGCLDFAFVVIPANAGNLLLFNKGEGKGWIPAALLLKAAGMTKPLPSARAAAYFFFHSGS